MGCSLPEEQSSGQGLRGSLLGGRLLYRLPVVCPGGSLSEQRSVHLQNDKSKHGSDYDYNQIQVAGGTLQWILERMKVLQSLSSSAVTPQRTKTVTENRMVMCAWLPSGSVAWPSGKMVLMVTNHVREDR